MGTSGNRAGRVAPPDATATESRAEGLLSTDSSTDASTDGVASVLIEPVAALGCDLEAVEITAAGSRRMLRVAIDKDGGVTMDDVAEATRVVSDALDASGLMGERAYTLEVTSRGVDRPLTLPRHWRRNAGRLVTVSLVTGERITGRIVETDDEGVTLSLDGVRRHVLLTEVAKALVQVEFNRREAD